jgi:SOS-response transcriptional repressor LexA
VRALAREEFIRLEQQRVAMLSQSGEFRAKAEQDGDDTDEVSELPVLDPVMAATKIQDVTADVKVIGSKKPPAEFRAQIGHDGFALQVDGMSMAGYTDEKGKPAYILPGDWVWVNPQDQKHKSGLVVAAVVEPGKQETGAVLKYHAGGDVLYSEPSPGDRQKFDCKVEAMTPVICITRDPWGG